MFQMDHYAISVKNVEKSMEFYSKLGFSVRKDWTAEDDTVRIVQMEKEGFLLEMFCYPDCQEIPSFVENLNTDLKVNGSKHMALKVTNLQEAASYLLQEGLVAQMPAISQGRLGRPYFFIKDPDGIFVEIISES